MADLQGRVFAIAGAAGGLGPSVARRLADDGATLALTDVHEERLDQLVTDLALPEDRYHAQVADLLSEQGAVDWAGALEQRFGRTDGLLHLVGGWRGGEPLAEAPLADYEFLHDALVRTLQFATRAFYGAMRASPHGRFIVVSSSQAQKPSGTNAAYAAAKAAAESWTLALADQFKADEASATANILVVNAILTPRMRAESPEKPFKTFTSADDIATAIAYLCSDGAEKMNGKRLALHP